MVRHETNEPLIVACVRVARLSSPSRCPRLARPSRSRFLGARRSLAGAQVGSLHPPSRSPALSVSYAIGPSAATSHMAFPRFGILRADIPGSRVCRRECKSVSRKSASMHCARNTPSAPPAAPAMFTLFHHTAGLPQRAFALTLSGSPPCRTARRVLSRARRRLVHVPVRGPCCRRCRSHRVSSWHRPPRDLGCARCGER